jgi:hypothetical protein
MSSTAGQTVRSIDDLEVIVDTDFHLTERQEDILPYLESPFDEMLNSQGGDDYGYLGRVYPAHGMVYSVTMGKADSETVRTVDDVKTGKALIEWDKAIITPTQNLYLGAVHHDDLAAALATAYNNWLLDEIVDPDEGLYGAALVAPQKPDEAAEEVRSSATSRTIRSTTPANAPDSRSRCTTRAGR